MDKFILWADVKYGHQNILRVESDKVVLMSGEVVSSDVFYAEQSNTLMQILMEMCDTKQEQAQKLILGEKATPLQLKRYDDKYERAKAGEFEDAVNQEIITKYEQARGAIRKFVDLIELFRGAVDDLIKAKEFDKAKALIEAGRGLNASTTPEQIQQLFGGA